MRHLACGVAVRVCGRRGDVGLGSRQATRRLSIPRPSRSISATKPPLSVDGENSGLRRSSPRLGAMVQRHDPDRPVRRCPHGRRRVRGARRRDQFRRRARARRGGAARRRRRSVRQRDRARATGCRRSAKSRRAGRSSGSAPTTRGPATARSCACARSSEIAGNLVAVGLRTLRQHPALQRPQDAARRPTPAATPARRRRRRRRAGRRSLLRHPRPRHGAAARQDRRRPRPRATSSRGCAKPPIGTAIRASRPACSTGAIPAMSYAPAAERHNDPYAGFEPRIVPENITLLPKTTTQATGGNAWNERTIVLEEGRHSVTAVLRELGANAEEIKAIAAALGPRGRDGSLQDGQKLRVLLAPASGGKRLQPMRVIICDRRRASRRWSRCPTTANTSRSTCAAPTRVSAASDDDEDDGKRRAALPEHLRDRAAQPGAAAGDRRTHPHLFLRRRFPAQGPARRFVRGLLFAGEDEHGMRPARPRCCSPRSPLGGETKRSTATRPPTTASSTTTTRPARARRSSWCASRWQTASCARASAARSHPILGYIEACIPASTGRPRWARRSSRPATASSRTPGWEGGYGKYIRIRHANGYETAYGHMSAFARGMEPGKRVRQGQVIGYVGSTGLSTGAAPALRDPGSTAASSTR